MPLSGPPRKKLREALMDSFQSYGELSRFCQDILQYPLARKTAPEAGLENNADALITLMDERGHVPQLVGAVRAERPERVDLRLLEQEIAQTFKAIPDVASLPANLSAELKLDVIKRGVERVIIESAGFASSETFISKMGGAEYCVCYISYALPGGKKAYGTGFLINDEMVITNEHVVKNAYPPGVPFTLTGDSIEVTFGFRNPTSNTRTYKLADDWLVTKDPKKRADGTTGLDYAILRLREKAGTEQLSASGTSALRGYLTPVSAALQPNAPVLILQHPFDKVSNAPYPMKLSIGFVTEAVGDDIRYTANTEEGSSGSPVFNAQMELVGLHYWGDVGFNAATVFSSIKQHLRANGFEGIFTPQR
jgi:hypothetical protein